jgi:hypothetical protein
MPSTIFPRLLLIFALLFAQLGGLTHGVEHALAERQAPDQSVLHHAHCDLCAAYAQIGSAIGSSGVHFIGSSTAETLPLTRFSTFTSNTFVAFAARAPPYSA